MLTDSYHVIADGKKVGVYGFKHENAVSGDIRALSFANLYAYNNWHPDCNQGIVVEYQSYGGCYYNYVDSATAYGIVIAMGCQAFVRANVFDSCNEGLRAMRGSIISGSGAAASVCYFNACDYDMEDGAGGVSATTQDYAGGGTYTTDANSWAT